MLEYINNFELSVSDHVTTEDTPVSIGVKSRSFLMHMFYVGLPRMQSPSCARVIATLTWFGSVTKPSFFPSHPLLMCCSFFISESLQERTVEMIT